MYVNAGTVYVVTYWHGDDCNAAEEDSFPRIG